VADRRGSAETVADLGVATPAMKRFIQFVLALARELSDETAYARYLEMHRVPRSPAAWRAFSDTRMREKFGRPKCC